MLDKLELANEIVESISVANMLNRYGFGEPNRMGFILCPFHNEKTPSLRVYSDNIKWKCFGCSEGGSVIDFVKKYFNLDFKESVIKLNYDFSLNLPIGQNPTYRQKQIMAIEQRKRKDAKIAEQLKKDNAESEYWSIYDEYLRLETNKHLYAPKCDTEALNPLFEESLSKLPYQENLLDMAEIKRGEKQIGRNYST